MQNPKSEEMKSSVAKNASLMGLATLFSRFLGLGREQVFAYLFGASDAADAFNIAFRIPNLLRDLFAEGAMSAAFVPNFTKTLQKSKQAAFDLLAGVISVLFLGLSVLTIVGIFFSKQLVDLYASAYKAIPGKFELSVEMTKIMFPFFPMVALAAVTMGALNALGKFFLPAFAPVLFNAASIICGLVLTPIFIHYNLFPPIYSMAIGVVVGGFFQFYIQWIQIKKEGFQFKNHLQAFRNPFAIDGVKSVLVLIIPGTLGLAATQLNILINSIYATNHGTGAVSWLNYSFRLMQFPIGIFGVSLAAATLPAVSKKLALGSKSEAADELAKSLKLTFAINLPAAAGLIAIGLPIIQLLFQHGKFQFSDSQQTANALVWYAVGLVGYSAVKVIVPIFYALKLTYIPVVISFVIVALNASLNHIFMNILHLPFWSLALATSITVTLNMIVLCILLNKHLPKSIPISIIKNAFLHLFIAVFMGAIGYLTVIFLQNIFEKIAIHSHIGWFFEVLIPIILSLSAWFLLGKLFRLPEIEVITQFASRKLKKVSKT